MSRLTAAVVSLLVGTVLLFSFPHWVAEASLPPHRFQGAAYLNNATVDAGTEVSAWVGGIRCATTLTGSITGQASYQFRIDVPTYDPATPDVPGANNGDTVSFKVAGVTANETSIFQTGGFSNVDLHAVTPPNSLVFVTATRIIIAGQPSAVMTVEHLDANGQPSNVQDNTVLNLLCTSANGSFSMAAAPWSPVTSVTMLSGTNLVSFYYNDMTVGTPTITVSTFPSQGWADASQQETITASLLEVSGITNPVVAGTVSAMTVTARDAYGNIATAYTGAIHFTSSDTQATLPDDYTFQASDNGTKTFSGGVMMKTAGEQWVRATDTVSGVFGEQTAITVNPTAATQLAVTGISTPVVAGTASIVTVTAKDAYGNAATSYTGTIHFTSSDAQATLPAGYTFQAADNGTKTFGGGVILKTAGEQWVQATDTVSGITGQQTAITVNPAAPPQLMVSGISTPVVAGTASGVTVTVKDAYGNIATSYTGTIHFTSSDAQATLPADYTFQASDNGTKTFGTGVTLKTAGEQWVQVTDTVSGVLGQQTAIAVNPTAVTQLVVTGISTPVVAGTASIVTVTAKDAYGNTATSYTGTIHFTSSDAQATLPADYTFQAADNGVKTFGTGVTLKTAGSQSVTATDTVTSSITGQQTAITVNLAAASQLVVTGITDPVVAGTASSVTVTAKDTYGNIATDYTGTIHFTSSDSQAMLPGYYTFQAGDNGVKTFSGGVIMKTVGEQWVKATDTISAIFGQQTAITVTPAAASRLEVTGITDPVVAGTASSVTVTAKDAYGNIATGYTGTIRFTSSDAQTKLPADYTFQAADNGVKTFGTGVTLKTAGSQSVTATDTVTSSITGQQTAITVNPGPASQLVVSGITTPVVAGTASSVTVTAKDAYGNIATRYTGTIHFTSSDAQAKLPADYIFQAGDNGVKTFSGGVTLKTAGSQSVTATDTVTSSITGQQTITVSQVPVHHKKTNWGAIVGGIVGGLAIISALVYYLWRRKRLSALLRRRRRPTVWLYHLLG